MSKRDQQEELPESKAEESSAMVDEGSLEAWPGPGGDTSKGQDGRRQESGRGRVWPALSDWNGKVGGDMGAPQGHTASLSSAGMWGFLGVREEIA